MQVEHIQLLRGTSDALASTNPTLLAGELGFETDTGKFKFGDGVTAWRELKYAAAKADGLTQETWRVVLDDGLDTEIQKKVAIWS
ncbi:MAG: hypothetical protein IJS28_07495 [Synergistaceae bacterium]|nr:hypothetical protein [Synergistaceae bacterium]